MSIGLLQVAKLFIHSCLFVGLRGIGPKKCCFRFIENPPKGRVVSYMRTSQRCSNPAVLWVERKINSIINIIAPPHECPDTNCLVYVCVKVEDSGRSSAVCKIFSYLGEGAHQLPGRQIHPRRGVQPVTMATSEQEFYMNKICLVNVCWCCNFYKYSMIPCPL